MILLVELSSKNTLQSGTNMPPFKNWETKDSNKGGGQDTD